MAELSSAAANRKRMAAAFAAILLLSLPPRIAGAIGSKAAAPASRPAEITILADSDYFFTVERLLGGARERIDLAMFLFKQGKARDNRPARLIEALIAARRKGLEVRVLLEHSGHDKGLNKSNQEAAEALRKGGVTVRFDSPNRTQHGKFLVVDGRYCVVGSHNLSQSALKYNHELSLLIDSPELARELLAYLGKLEN